MDVGKIVSNSFKYPFRNITKLPILFLLFVLMAIVPIGWILDNKYLLIVGFVAFFLFILIVPGYLFSMVKIGLNESALFPSLSFGKTIFNSIRVLILRMVYMIVPVCLFYISLSTLSLSGVEMLRNFDIRSFFLSVGLLFIISIIVYLIFEFLLFFAKARLAYLNSLTEAIKMHKVVGDIINIGIFNIIKWLIFMLILVVVFSVISSWVVAIPYVGYLIYFCVIIPILESIGNYSLGLLYSNITRNNNGLVSFENRIY